MTDPTPGANDFVLISNATTGGVAIVTYGSYLQTWQGKGWAYDPTPEDAPTALHLVATPNGDFGAVNVLNMPTLQDPTTATVLPGLTGSVRVPGGGRRTMVEYLISDATAEVPGGSAAVGVALTVAFMRAGTVYLATQVPLLSDGSPGGSFLQGRLPISLPEGTWTALVVAGALMADGGPGTEADVANLRFASNAGTETGYVEYVAGPPLTVRQVVPSYLRVYPDPLPST